MGMEALLDRLGSPEILPQTYNRNNAENSCCPGSAYRPGLARPQWRSSSPRRTHWALSTETLGPLLPQTQPFAWLLLITLQIHFPLPVCSPAFPTLFFLPFCPHIFPPLSSPLPSPHLRSSFLSFPGLSKSFLMSELLFCLPPHPCWDQRCLFCLHACLYKSCV